MGTALLAALFLGERLSLQSWTGIACICAGVIGLATMSLRRGGLTWTGFAFAAANAGIVMLYTLVDGHGARLSGNPAGYAMLLEALCGPMLLPCLLLVLRGNGPRNRSLPSSPTNCAVRVSSIRRCCSRCTTSSSLKKMVSSPIAPRARSNSLGKVWASSNLRARLCG